MHIPVAPDVVFSALTTDRGRTRFWAESSVEHEGVIQFRFVNGVTHQSRIVETEPPRMFAIEYFGSLVRFELSDDGRGGTDLDLANTGVPAHEWHEVFAGWLNVLFPLKAWLVCGIDLRNHDPLKTWDRGYADQ
jgi:uncharacterized protein YndB with AHSA1/START domain